MNTCPACGAQYPSTVRLCTRDGTVLESAAPTDAHVGRVLDGKYRLDARLNAGGMGTVYRATHLMLGKQVAVKLINAELVTSPEIVRRFQREARAASALNHPNIAPAYDLGQTEDGTLYIAMEFIAGHSLREVIRAQGQLDTARIVRILRQVASALSLAHRHEIIHRDLKPHNIMLATDDAGRENAKLLDFGIAKTFDDAGTQLTATGFALGTPQYMSPEQATGQPVDGRSDLYALGVILYEMLIGEVPFNDPSTPAVLVKQVIEPAQRPSLRRPDLAISPELEAIALRCLEKDPAARFQSAEEFAAALEPLVGSHATLIPSEVATVVLPATGAPARAAGPTVPTAPAVDPMAPTVVMGDAATKTARPGPVIPAPQAPASTVGRATPIQPPTRTAAVPPPAAVAAAAPATAPPSAPAPSAAVAASTAPSGSGKRFLAFAAVIIVLLVGIGGFAAYGFGLFKKADSSAQTNTGTATPQPPPDTSTSATPPANPLQSQSQPVGQQASASPAGAGAGNPGASAGAPPPAPPAATRPGPPPPGAGSAGGNTAPPPPTVTAPPPPPPPTPAPAAPPKSEIPTVFFRCSGAPELCSSIRSAVDEALDKESIPTTDDLDRGDIFVDARVAFESETTQQMFGATFVVRTFTTELVGRAKPNRRVPMPAPMSVSFDPRNRVERAAEHGRLVAAAVVDRILRFVGRRGGDAISSASNSPLRFR